MKRIKTIPILIVLCFWVTAPLFADRFSASLLRIDTRVGTELSPINDGIQDLPVLVAAWGNCESCHADQTGNGVVEIADLRIIIAKWS